MVWLLYASNEVNKNNYAHVVDSYLGKVAGAILSIIFIFLCYGAMIMYIIVTTNFMPKTFIQLGMDEEFSNSKEMRMIMITCIIIGLFPLALKRNLSGV